MRKTLPTLTDLISQLEEYRHDGIDAIEYRLDELLAVLRWNNTPEGHAENKRANALQNVIEYIVVLGPREREAALLLILKAARIHDNAELVETWLASVNQTGSVR